MSKDIIYREDAIKAINLKARIPHDVASALYASMAINAIYSVPSADRPQGAWELVLPNEVGEFFEAVKNGCLWECSICGAARKGNTQDMNFCPNCGAKMDGERKTND